MTASNKEDFLFQLHNELHRIGIDADEDIFSDFEEHFKLSADEGLSEEETCRRLGDVKEIARGYLNMESSRINSLVAREVESERPRVSLTKPGHDEPADSSLKAETTAQNAPIREYTPEHISEEIYPNASERVNLVKPQEQPEQAQQTEQAQQSEQTAQEQSQTDENGKAKEPQTVAEAFSAAGKAAAAAFRTAGHAVAEAVNTDAVKDAGKAAAEAVVSAGHVVADAVRTSAENIKAEHEARAAQNAQAQAAQAESVPHPQNTARECQNDCRVGYVPPQDEKNKVKTGKEFSFASIKDMKPNVNAGKLIGVLLLDVFVWWWLVIMLGSIAAALGFGAFPEMLAAGFTTLFNGASEYYMISRVFLGVAQISGGVIFLLLAFLLIRGIIKIVKNVVISHIKAIYDL